MAEWFGSYAMPAVLLLLLWSVGAEIVDGLDAYEPASIDEYEGPGRKAGPAAELVDTEDERFVGLVGADGWSVGGVPWLVANGLKMGS